MYSKCLVNGIHITRDAVEYKIKIRYSFISLAAQQLDWNKANKHNIQTIRLRFKVTEIILSS